MALRRLFGATSKVADYWDADDSGIAVQPRKGSNVPPHLRVHFWVAHTAQTFLSGNHLQALNERFVLNLKKQIDAKGVGEQWVEYPDLYAFVQSMVGRSATDTLMGPRLLELSPELLDDFRIFDNNLLNFLFGRRRWMARAAYEARDRLLEAVARWHGEALEKAGANVDRTAPEDPEFDMYFGSKLLRSRQSAMMKMGLDGHDKASLDVGLMFAYVHIPMSLDVEGVKTQNCQLTRPDRAGSTRTSSARSSGSSSTRFETRSFDPNSWLKHGSAAGQMAYLMLRSSSNNLSSSPPSQKCAGSTSPSV